MPPPGTTHPNSSGHQLASTSGGLPNEAEHAGQSPDLVDTGLLFRNGYRKPLPLLKLKPQCQPKQKPGSAKTLA